MVHSSRRWLLRTSAGTIAASLAGCTERSGDETSPPAEETTNDGRNGGPTASPADTPATTVEPSPGGDHVFVETDGQVAIEAEHYNRKSRNDTPRAWYLTSPTTVPDVEPDPDENPPSRASNDAYVEILPDTRVTEDDELEPGVNFWGEPGTGPLIEYDVRFETAGVYRVWARANRTGSEDNGVHVGIDGRWPDSGARMQWCSPRGAFTWSAAQRTAEEHCGVPKQIQLEVPEPGLHTIAFAGREDGFELDAFLLTTDMEYDPTRAGRVEGLAVTVNTQPNGSGNVRLDVEGSIARVDGTTRYAAVLPWSELPIDAEADVLGVSLLVNDDDGDGRIGWVEWGSGVGLEKDPTQFRTATFGSRTEGTYGIREYEQPPDGSIDPAAIPSQTIDLDAEGSAKPEDATPTVGGRVWLTYSERGLRLAAIVEDETHHQEYGVFSMWRGDSIQLGIADGPPAEATSYQEYTIGGNPP